MQRQAVPIARYARQAATRNRSIETDYYNFRSIVAIFFLTPIERIFSEIHEFDAAIFDGHFGPRGYSALRLNI